MLAASLAVPECTWSLEFSLQPKEVGLPSKVYDKRLGKFSSRHEFNAASSPSVGIIPGIHDQLQVSCFYHTGWG